MKIKIIIAFLAVFASIGINGSYYQAPMPETSGYGDSELPTGLLRPQVHMWIQV